MISLNGFFVLLSIPIRLLWTIFKYPFVGGANEKYKNNLTASLRLEMARGALKIPICDAAVISLKNADAIINTVVPSRVPFLVQGLKKYGQRFDKQSFWLVEAEGRSNDDPILIYLHGGGYYIDVQKTQIESVLAIYHLLEPKAKSKLSILDLDYKLVFEGHHITTQLYQLAETYEKLVQAGNTNIILMGDSAGGHLAITFLQYLKQLDSKVTVWPRSAILISPWVRIRSDPAHYIPGNSWYDNSPRDMISFTGMQQKSRQAALVGNLDVANMLVSPGNLPYKNSDWDDIPTLNYSGYSAFIILGEHELFRDDVLEWSKYAVKSPLRKQSKDSGGILNETVHIHRSGSFTNNTGGAYVEVVVEPWGIHDAAMVVESNVAFKLGNDRLTVADIDNNEFFGITRIVDFLNKIL